MTRLLVIAPPDFAPLDLLGREAPDVALSIGTESEQLRNDAAHADAVLIAPRYGALLTELWRDLGNVRWIHTLAAGVEFLPFDLLRRTDVVVTSSRGLYADALGEFAIAAMLWFAKDLRRMVRNQDARRWEPYTVERLEERTVGIVGYGGVGEAVGRRAAALGMRVLPVRRRQEFGEPTLDEVIAQSDYVVLSTPLTPGTYRLLSRERIAAMKPNAVLINLGRGATVDEDALLDALRNQRIRGAALDVFEAEPLPADHPLWQFDNVLISPHTADHTADAHVRAMQFFIENLKRFRAGESLQNVVDKHEQY
ncbi:MAG TPA: D-2-hydroxyacid dehydrogenase [Thermoanaerobaculia bacterium]|nr:D-2-hydroxyacid dehydrogenase [Thermoanaerobaculia bacterium]